MLKRLLAVLVAVLCAGGAGQAQDSGVQDMGGDYVMGRPTAPSQGWLVSQGGRLYDNWPAVKQADGIKKPHPSFAKSKGDAAATWRCKTCHGWDYAGSKRGPALTPQPLSPQPLSPAALDALLRAAPHGYAPDMLGDDDITALQAFLSQGLLAVASYVDPATGKAQGDPARGQPYFETICAACHGYDGRTLNFGSGDAPAYVGTEAVEEPREVLHKIRFGHPGQAMVALFQLGPRTAADILAYVQTLPAGDD